MIPEFAIIWVCYECGEYYASSSAGDLRMKFNTDIKGDITFPRARCPTASCAARNIMRTPVMVRLSESQPTKSEPNTNDLPHWLEQPCQNCGRPLIATGNLIICSGCSKITEMAA